MTSRLGRLSRLEATAALNAPGVQETLDQRAAYEAAWQIMQTTMSPEHIGMVVQAYAAGFHDSGSDGFNSPAGRLLRRCLGAVCSQRRQWPYSDIPDEVAFAMPPVLAEVYLTNPGALPLHDCEECGLTLPHGFFDGCPLCGGRIGWYAYFTKHRQ